MFVDVMQTSKIPTHKPSSGRAFLSLNSDLSRMWKYKGLRNKRKNLRSTSPYCSTNLKWQGWQVHTFFLTWVRMPTQGAVNGPSTSNHHDPDTCCQCPCTAKADMIEPKVTSSGCLKRKEDAGVGSLMEGSITNFNHQLLNLFRHFNRKTTLDLLWFTCYVDIFLWKDALERIWGWSWVTPPGVTIKSIAITWHINPP